ncbi:MAG: flippase-like domain-containing protein [Acidobacteria bacterium]|nr:flippase-like domain-containing protein [Acidobacteriota bacterium]
MRRAPLWRGVFVAATLAVGVGLFVRSVQTLGADRITDGLARVGWGFAIILALSGARDVARTLAWMRSVEGPTRLGFANAFRARLAGEALSTLLPMGILAGEPAKALQVGWQLPFATAFAAIAVEFAFYICSLFVLLATGVLALLATGQMGASSRWLILAALSLAIGGGFATVRFIRTRVVPVPVPEQSGRASATSAMTRTVARLARLENLSFGFARRHPEQLLPIGLLETAFQVLGVAEVYVTLWFISPVPPKIVSAVILETVGRVVMMVFKFLPMRVGVDEAAAAVFAARLDLGMPTGITLALVRKARMLFWSAVGLALLARTPLAGTISRGWLIRFLRTGCKKTTAPRTHSENALVADAMPRA